MVACALLASEAHAQQITWGAGYPAQYKTNGVTIQGKTSLTIGKVLVWAYVNGGEKSSQGADITVDLGGNWGLPSNVGVKTTPNKGDTVIVIVQGEYKGKIYELSGSVTWK